MAYRLVVSPEAESDLSSIFDFLYESYRALGDETEEALDRATARIRGFESDLSKLVQRPHRGTVLSQYGVNIRCATLDRMVTYFKLDEDRRTIIVLAIFFGGQDHQRRFLIRYLAGRA